MNEPKFCKDCRFFLYSPYRGTLDECRYPQNLKHHLVNGAIIDIDSPVVLRSPLGNCGVQAVWFEPKPPRKKFLGIF